MGERRPEPRLLGTSSFTQCPSDLGHDIFLTTPSFPGLQEKLPEALAVSSAPASSLTQTQRAEPLLPGGAQRISCSSRARTGTEGG